MMRARASVVACLVMVSAFAFGCSKKNEVAVGQACAQDSECPDDGNPCTDAICNEGTCEYKQTTPDGTAIDEGGKCYQTKLCQGCWDTATNDCQTGTENKSYCGANGDICQNCDDKNACTDDACNQGACTHDAIDPLPDGGAPTPNGCAGACWGDQCCGGCWDENASACKQGQSDPTACGLGGNACKICDDGNPCTANLCSGGVCDYKTKADDGTACPNGQCHDGGCCAGCWNGTACETGLADDGCGLGGAACADCTQSNPCMASTCDNGTCTTPMALDGVACPNGVCVQGTCECGKLGQPCCSSGTACENALACSNGTCGDCGAAGELCCPPNDSCAAGNICQSGNCTPCGQKDQPCCTGSSCQGQTVCQTDVCVACGGTGQPCCGGTTCDAGNNCTAGNCAACGGLNQPCCQAGTACSATDTVCSSGSCLSCGAIGEPCCGGTTCDTWAACTSSNCTACGKAGESCCSGGTACDSYLACTSNSCKGCIQQLSNGSDHRCAVRTDGTLWCWGQNGAGQLGTGDTSGKGSPTQITSQGTGAVVEVAAGSSRTAVRKADGTVWNLAVSTTQINFGAGILALEVAAGGDFSCARVTDGTTITIRCWINASSPPSTVTLPGSRVPADITVGGHHACAAAIDGTAWCWGQNESGQLGNGNTTPSTTTPVHVTWLSGSPTITQVSAGNSFTCALTSDHKTWCWGNSTDYQLGTGSSQAINPYPLEVTALSTDAAAVATGRAHACVRKSNGEAWCWGSNAAGQAGPGGANPMQAPTKVAFFGTSAASSSAGGNESCAIRTDGTAWCHGNTPTQVAISCP